MCHFRCNFIFQLMGRLVRSISRVVGYCTDQLEAATAPDVTVDTRHACLTLDSIKRARALTLVNVDALFCVLNSKFIAASALKSV